MASYKRGQKIGTAWNYRECALGSSGNKGTFTDADFGKPLKLAADSTYDVCADGNEIEEVFEALAAQQSTVNGGYQIGTIRDNGTARAIVGAGTVAIGNIVVASAQAALGTSNSPAGKPTTAFMKVKVAGDATAQAAVKFRWRVVAILVNVGGGGVGSEILIERC